MPHSRSAIFFVALALLRGFCGNADAQKVDMSSSIKPQVLSLNRANHGQHVVATVGQPIEVTLQTIGPGQYGTPQVSSPVIRFENVAVKMPANPGGPTQVYIFDAVAEGEAQVQIPHTASNQSFTVTIRVEFAAGEPHPSRTTDQANTAAWTQGWTNLVNDARQTFTPSLPRLTNVEVDLVVANPGPTEDTVTMTLLDAGGESLAVVSKTVPVADCGHVLFVFASPG